MTTEQAADRLGALAVTFPKMKPAMQAQMYAQLRADEQEAMRVLFGYGESEDQPETPMPAPVTVNATDELIAALQRFAATARRAETTTVVVNDSPTSQTPTAPNSSNLADYLRLLAAEIDKRQAPTPTKAPEVKQRQRVDVSDQLASARATRLVTATTSPAAACKPRPRPKLVLPPPPVRPQLPTPSPYPYGMTKESYIRVQRAGIIALIQCWLFIIAVILFPVLLIWACWE